jgi:lysophospholipase L1-like esterase
VRSAREIFAGPLVSIATILVAFLLLEIGFRVRAIYHDARELWAFRNLAGTSIPDDGVTADLRHIIRLSTHRRIIYELVPNLSITYSGAPLTTNSDGFRGSERSRRPDERTIRIIGLGDSVMFGNGVSDDEFYLALLEQYLNEDYPDALWQTVNTAVPGYNTVMEVETLKRRCLQLHPDLVIVGFVGNDLCLPNFIRKKRYHLALTSSYVLAFLSSRRLRSASPSPLHALVYAPDHPTEDKKEDNPERVPEEYQDLVGEEAFHRAMEELAALGRTHGFEVLVASHEGAWDYVTDACSRLDLPFVSTAEATQQYMRKHLIDRYWGSALTASKDDPHPSAVGHRVIAAALYEYIGSSGLCRTLLERRGLWSGTSVVTHGERLAQALEAPSTQPPPPQTSGRSTGASLVTNGGFDGLSPWDTISARVAGGTAVITRAVDADVSLVRQRLLTVEENTAYVISARLRARRTPNAPVIIDLVGTDNYENDRRKLVIPAARIGRDFKTFRKVISSDTPPDHVVIRVVSESTVPVVVDDVALIREP